MSLILLLAAICVGRETANKRKTQRLFLQSPINIYQASGTCSRSVMRDISMGGCRIDNFANNGHVLVDDPITDLEIFTGYTTVCVKVKAIEKGENINAAQYLHFSFEDVDLDTRRELVRLIFSRAEAWERPKYKKDRPIVSFFTILACIKDSLLKKKKNDDIHVSVVGKE